VRRWITTLKQASYGYRIAGCRPQSERERNRCSLPVSQQYAYLCVEEPENARCADILQHLQLEEAAVYQHLQQTHQRLEQERIPMAYVQRQLNQLKYDFDI